MKNPWSLRTAALAVVALFAGCSLSAAANTSVDLDTALARASELKQPLILLITELGQSPADDAAAALFKSRAVKAASAHTVTVLLDISISRNRAAATRFHVVETPLLLCLASRGIIASRDEKPITKSLLLQRISEVTQHAPELDAQLASLTQAAAKNTTDPTIQFALTDFLLAHHNAFEAIPPLANLAHSEATAPALRIRAWVALVRAHFWIAEPEKGRHEAEALLATLGPTTPEARAGGELVLGIQDATAKRAALARREFDAAIAAAPESPYSRQAAEALANLPKGTP